MSALVTDAGQMLEWVKYSAYGVPFGLPGGDADSDGDCDGSDLTQVTTWVEMGPYDVRGDVDLDGDVDETDSSVASSTFEGISLGRAALSALGIRSRRGVLGISILGTDDSYLVKSSVALPTLGMLGKRDLYSGCSPPARNPTRS